MHLFTDITLIKRLTEWKIVRGWILSRPHFLAFVLNTESYSVNLRIQPNARK